MRLEELDIRELLEIDPEGGTVRFAGQRALILDAVAMGLLRKQLVDSFGQVAANYDTPNVFMYAKGDEIAYSNASSSDTTFTISYMFNISNVTPGGTYTMNHVLVATATY